MPWIRRLAWLLLAIALLVPVAGWLGYAHLRWPVAAAPREVVVGQGDNARTLAASLARQGVGVPAWAFELAVRARGDATRLRAGSFALDGPVTLRALIDELVRGDATGRELRIVEGWNLRQVRQALAAQPDLRRDLAGLTEAETLARLGASEPSLEGLFFPDTYAYAPQAGELSVLRRAYQRQQAMLAQAWERRRPGLPLRTPYEALILASIVEKETGRPEDRREIAAVFVNRLRRGMRLQSDPTTIYGLGEAFDGDLRRRDLAADTPYNTYVHAGLPPTPIAMPGLAALQAALDPADSRALYFVSRGDGTSHFSETLEAHNRAVRQYQQRAR